MVEAQMAPKHLAEALDNAVLGSKEKYPLNPTVEVAIDQGELRATGFTRWTGVVDRRPLTQSDGDELVVLDYEEVAAFVKDHLRKVKGFSTKGASVDVTLSHDELAVQEGTSVLGRLGRSQEADSYEGDGEHEGFYEYLLNLEATSEPLTPIRHMRTMKESLLLVKDLKMSRVIDGKWVAANAADQIDIYGLTDKIVGIEYGTARVIMALGGILQLDDE